MNLWESNSQGDESKALSLMEWVFDVLRFVLWTFKVKSSKKSMISWLIDCHGNTKLKTKYLPITMITMLYI